MFKVKMFAETVAREIKEYLPASYEDLECKVVEQQENNGGCLSGICFQMPGQRVAPIIYMEPYYQKVCQGEDVHEVKKLIAEMIKQSKVMQSRIEKVNVTDFVSVKDHLFAMLINTRANRHTLLDLPHLEIEDLSVIFYLKLPVPDGDEIGSIKITNDLMEQWGIEKEELLNTVFQNMQKTESPILSGLESVMSECIFGEPAENLLENTESYSGNPIEMMYVLSNKSRHYGAAALMFPGVMGKVSQIFPEGFYILPSSIHEVIITPKNEDVTPQELGRLVREINRDQLAREDILSDHVYEYDLEKGKIRQVPESMERGKELER